MSIQTINIGTGSNTGDGDTLRTAMSKINSNFADPALVHDYSGGTGAKVDASGNMLIGTTTGATHTVSKNGASNNALNVVNSSSSTPYGPAFTFTGVTGGTGGAFLQCQDNSTRMQIAGNGNVTNTNNSYGAISDAKLKENVVTARDYLDDLNKIRVVKYSLIADHEDHATHLGVIAQELETIFPSLIDETRDTAMRSSGQFEQKVITPAVMDGEHTITPAVIGDDETKPVMEMYETGGITKSVKYSVLVPMLITAVQNLSAQNKAL